MIRHTTRLPLLLIALTMSPTVGCRDGSVEIAREAADRQAGQNAEMIRLNREVAHGTQRLVTGDAEARRDLLAEQSKLSAAFDDLEVERQELDRRRRTAATLETVAQGIALAIAAMLTLALSWQILASAANDGVSEELVDELFALDLNPSIGPPLAAPPPQLTHDPLSEKP